MPSTSASPDSVGRTPTQMNMASQDRTAAATSLVNSRRPSLRLRRVIFIHKWLIDEQIAGIELTDFFLILINAQQIVT
jgi:hypothetical protein